MSDFIFLYGTLRRGFPETESQRRLALTRWVGRGAIHAALYDLGEYPGAVPSSSAEDRVHGEVHELAENGLAVLDGYEVRVTGSELGGRFIRARTEVELESGGRIEAWVYFYNRPLAGAPRIPSGDYVSHRKGALPPETREP
jgi:gamma-glutamylcyclotransferase (GGCT)/AIG2-like uncharacterized protein YtfP